MASGIFWVIIGGIMLFIVIPREIVRTVKHYHQHIAEGRRKK